ncbi:MAG TPA: hypothetical protein VKF17_06830 [Isosphaeraceae bacterium]|nr:hypothetical protein [Isosphaeraceae bacterium]
MSLGGLALPRPRNALTPEHRSQGHSEYLRSLIRDAQKRLAKRELEAKFREAMESGPATPITREDWVALRAEAIEGLAGETIRP